MLPYFLVLLIPLVGAIAYSRRDDGHLGLWIFLVVLLVFVGLRDEIGPDWFAYGYIYEAASFQPLTEIFYSREPGFFLINKASEYLDAELYGVNFISALIFLVGVFSFAKTTANPWMSIAAVTPFLIYIVSMSGIRQSAAIGVGYFLFARWGSVSILWKLLLIAVAISFHNSAIILLVFVVFKLDQYLILRLLVMAAVVFVSAGAMQETDSFKVYQKTYIEENIESTGAYMHVLLSAFPAALFIYFRNRIQAVHKVPDFIFPGALLAIAAIFLIPLSSTGVSRIALYLSFVQMWVYPAIGEILPEDDRDAYKAFFVLMILAIFFTYFLFGAHVFAYLPYRSLLFSEGV